MLNKTKPNKKKSWKQSKPEENLKNIKKIHRFCKHYLEMKNHSTSC